MNQLSQEDLEILEKLRRDDARRESIPESLKHPITNPDKYSSPIGVDDNGNFFPVPPKQK